MKITIHPSSLNGTIQAAASKSSMQRACAAALLSKNKIFIKNPGHSNDDLAAQEIIKALGAVISPVDDETIAITSNFLDNQEAIQSKENKINCGESGLSVRMFTPLAALCKNEIIIEGEGSLLTRPMHFFDEIFPALGVAVTSNDGKLPLKIHGPLQAKNIEIDGSLSSQFLTGLLLAYAVTVHTTPVSITVKDLKSKPYIDLTLDVMKKFGFHLPENINYETFRFLPNTRDTGATKEITYTVEGDWSGGAFLLVAGAIAGNIRISGLQLTSTQADKKIIDALMAANAGIAMDAKGITLHAAPMNAFEFDATDCPDLFPPLVALAAYCKGTTKIKGVSRLAHKESDRGKTLQEEFAKFGVTITLNADEMLIDGGNPLQGTVVHSRRDHRIAMACAVAALKAQGETTIEEAQAINKSYPDFYDHLKQLGATIHGDTQLKAILTAFKDVLDETDRTHPR